MLENQNIAYNFIYKLHTTIYHLLLFNNNMLGKNLYINFFNTNIYQENIINNFNHLNTFNIHLNNFYKFYH